MTILKADVTVGRAIQLYGEWAENEITFLKRLIEPGNTVLDIGGYIGTHTLAFSQFVGSHGSVVVFEPRPECFEVLRRNVYENECVNVRLEHAAAGDRCGIINVPTVDFMDPINFGALGLKFDAPSNASAESTSNKVRVLPIDSLELKKCALLKIDVEGVENLVIEGARETIQRCDPYIYAECNSISAGIKTLNIIKDIGYTAFIHIADAYNPNNYAAEIENIFGNCREIALLGVPVSRRPHFENLRVGQTDILLPVDDEDDIAFCLLQKPQFMFEALEPSSAGIAYKKATGRSGEPNESLHALQAKTVVMAEDRQRLEFALAEAHRLTDEACAERDKLAEQNAASCAERDKLAEQNAAGCAERDKLAEQNAAARSELDRMARRPWRPLKHYLIYVVMTRLAALIDPVSQRSSQRFAKSAEKRSPWRFSRPFAEVQTNPSALDDERLPDQDFRQRTGSEGVSLAAAWRHPFNIEKRRRYSFEHTQKDRISAWDAADYRSPLAIRLAAAWRHPFNRDKRRNYRNLKFRPLLGWPTHHVDIVDIGDNLPQCAAPFVAPDNVVVDIIIPVHSGLEETRRCLETVLADQDRPNGNIIVIDDCSPMPELSEWLETIAAKNLIKLLKNPKNLGFVGTVNRGMIEAGDNDVLLLNSDTEVPTGWLRRIVAHAYSGDRIGSVTPYSNNATICSYPSFQGGSLPRGFSLSELDNACRMANSIRSVDIPTAVGFCMYIRRDCLREVGLFDQEAFGRGYGEENDFCMRATSRGWRHILACDTFVYHAGEVSFGRNSPERNMAWDILIARHPLYPALIAEHIRDDSGAGYRFAITVALFRASARPTILMVTHNWGGGTERHVQELASATNLLANVVVLHANLEAVELSIPALVGHPVLSIRNENRDHLLQVLNAFGIARVHVHHWINANYDLQALIDQLGVPFDVTIHDYFAICPQINLRPNSEEPYCGELGLAECDSCIAQTPAFHASSIIEWRAKHAWLIHEAARVICPSQDVANRITKYYPRNKVVVVPHEPIASEQWRVFAPPLKQGERLRVAVLGHLTAHKGRKAVEMCLTDSHNGLVDFRLIGAASPPFARKIAARLQEMGVYDEADLGDKIVELAPHVIWFPQPWPETYSYTLSAAIAAERPIVAPKLGAFPERLEGRPLTWLQDDPACPASEWLATFDAVRTRLLAETNSILNGERANSAPFYPKNYLEPVEPDHGARAGKLIDLRQEGQLTALVLPDRLDNGNISPCGFIRLVLPLDHVAHSHNGITVEHVTFGAALRRIADVMICQRHVVKDIRLADELITHCRETGMRLVYDLDDDLINTDEHPEHEYLQRLAPIVIRMLINADEVWVSTDELKQRVLSMRADAIVLPNRLDERLWVETGVRKLLKSDPVRILYMGTMTHEIDLAFLEEVAEHLKQKFGSGVAFEIIGVTAKAHLHPLMTRCMPPETASASYPGFVEWMTGQSHWDIGVAPLVDTMFARAKSGIKALDYSALGLPVVASDVEAYRGALNEQDGVKLVPNNADAWVAALSDLIQDHEKRRELGRRARKAFLSTNSLRVADNQWSIALNRAAGVSCSVIRKSKFNFCEIDKNGLVSISREILAAAFLHGEGIEVGALHNPLRFPGEARVRYVDRLDNAGLIEHYPELGNLPLVHVDYVDDGELLESFAAETQDFVIANHFLEHCEDPLTTIANHLRVVRPGGFIYMAVPDKRKTFDKDREITPLSHIIADFEHGGIQSRRRHYEEWVTLVEPYFGRDYKSETKEIIAERIEQLMKQAYSIHFHCWARPEVLEMLEYAKNVLRYPFDVELVVEREEEIIFILRRKARGEHPPRKLDAD